MPNIYEVAQSFRRALVQRERKAAVRLVEAYGRAYERLSAQLGDLLTKIEEAKANKEPIDQAWLLREERYFTLLNQVLKEISRFADLAGGVITNQQRQAMRQALQDSQQLFLTQIEEAPEGISAEFNRLSTAATENLVGFLSDGSPLNSLLGRLAPEARGIVERGLTNGVIQGRGPRAVAREIREGLNGNLTRALKIARTETIRSYREASHRTYQENSDVLEGWIWLSALNKRTCRACIALHGTFHEITERLKGHVQCRCTQVPAVKGVDPGIEKGADWFAKQPASIQKEILDAKGEYEAYKSGMVKLEDFTGLRQSLQWGDSYQALSLQRALAGEGKFPGDAQRPEPLPKPVKKPKAKKPPEFPDSIQGLEPVRSLGGSTGAQLVRDPSTGKQFVLKRGSSADHLREEFTADQAYKALGMNVPKAKLYETEQGPVKLAQFIEGKPLSKLTAPEREKAETELRKHFAADALIGNWDVIGLSEDNILVDKAGKVFRIDNGGALRFRAQGARKTAEQWDQYPTELWSMRDRAANPQAAKVFEKLSIYDVRAQIDEVVKSRAKLLKVFPEDLKETIKGRFEQLKYVAETVKTLEEDKWVADYTDGFTKHIIGLRKSGIVDKLPKRLKQTGETVTPKDENGVRFDKLRGAGSIVGDLAEYMSRAGTDHQIISRHASDQAGSSWSNIPAAIKVFFAKQRGLDESAHYWKNGYQDALNLYNKAVEKLGEEKLKTAWQIQHAFHFELLNKVDLRYNDRKKKVIRLLRTEDIRIMQRNGLNPGSDQYVKRGAHESASLYKPVFVYGSETTVQYVPHHRITASYLLERSPGYGYGSFLSDSENEFLFLTEGIKFDYLGYKKKP